MKARVLLSVAAALCLVARVTDAAPHFRFQDLGTLGGTSSSALGINALGEVVGMSDTTGDASQQAFLWLPAANYGLCAGIHSLGTVTGYLYTEAVAINDNGDVAIHAFDGSMPPHEMACLWLPASRYGLPAGLNKLGTLSGGQNSRAYSINNAGQVVGSSERSSPGLHGFLWSNGSFTDLGAGSGGFESMATTINQSGTIAGQAYFTGQPSYTAATWKSGAWANLGVLSGHTNSCAWGINDAGKVVGYSGISYSPPWDGLAFLHDGAITSLGKLGGTHSTAHAINSSDQVVGYSDTAADGYHGYLWQDGTMSDINGLVFASPWALNWTADINNNGQIAASGQHACLLTPWVNNGGFERGNLGGWTSSGSGAAVVGPDPDTVGGFVASLRPLPGQTLAIAQQIETPGTDFCVEFDYKFVFGGALDTLEVTLDGNLLCTISYSTGLEFHASLPVAGPELYLQDMELAFEFSRGSGGGILELDNVDIVPLTSPLLPGDATGDGQVDEQDAAILAAYWGRSNITWATGDFNGDGLVGAADASILAANWTQVTHGEAASVPEPAAVFVLTGLGVPGLLVAMRRRRSRT